jgi:hypothetical protein
MTACELAVEYSILPGPQKEASSKKVVSLVRLEHVIEEALKKGRPDHPEDKFPYLQRVFSEFGHFVPALVLLGGLLFCKTRSASIGAKEEGEYKVNLDMAA